MTCNQSKKQSGQKTKNDSRTVTVCGMTVHLAFAAEKNCTVPKAVGEILMGAYLRHQNA